MAQGTPYWNIQGSFANSPVAIDRKVVGKCLE